MTVKLQWYRAFANSWPNMQMLHVMLIVFIITVPCYAPISKRQRYAQNQIKSNRFECVMSPRTPS